MLSLLTCYTCPAGACGRCYEVRCKEGLLLGWDDQPIPISETYYPPAHASAPDSYGRQFPGNPAEKDGQIYIKCWDKQKSIKVKIIDICPCYYCPEIGEAAACTHCLVAPFGCGGWNKRWSVSLPHASCLLTQTIILVPGT